MDIKQLISFVSIAESNSFTNAANKNALTRSAVSKQINSLENELGVELFVTNGRKIQLTECGKELLFCARNIIKEAEIAKDKIKGIQGTITGTLRIGVGSFVEPYIRRAAYKMLRDFPELNMDVKIEQAKTLNERLRKHDIDIAFTLNNSKENEHIESEPLVPITICAVVRKTHELANRSEVTMDELMRYQIIMPDEDKRSIQTVEKFFGVNLDGLKTRVVINNADAAFCSVEEEGFVSFTTPEHIINRQNLIALRIKGFEKQIMCNAHWMNDCYLKNSAKLFLDYIKNYSLPYFQSIIDV